MTTERFTSATAWYIKPEHEAGIKKQYVGRGPMTPAQFREIVEPGANAAFEDAYSGVDWKAIYGTSG